MARKGISKKTRFEVFKRDSFTCQYCGKCAPEVVLHIDHIVPVSGGGDNSILNLITSCQGCNLGKGARRLDDASAAAKQMKAAKELNERREQLKMLAEWRTGLSKIKEESADLVANHIATVYKVGLTEVGKSGLRRAISKYGMEMVIEAAEKSANQYLIDHKSAADREKFINYIPRICFWLEKQKDNPDLVQFSKLCAFAAKRWWKCNKSELWKVAQDYHYNGGVSFADLFAAVANSSGIMAFTDLMEEAVEHA